MTSAGARPAVNLYPLPDFLAIGALVAIFISLLRRTQQTRMRYWVVGWALVLAHIAAEFVALNIGAGSDTVSALSAVTLLLASAAFIWAAQTPQRNRTRTLVRTGLAELPNVAFIFCLYGNVQSGAVYLGLVTVGALGALLAINAGTRGGDRVSRRLYAGGITAAYAIQAALVLRGDIEFAFDWMLCWHYLAVAILFWTGSARRSPGVVFTTASFLAWAAVFPAAAVLQHFAPAVHVESEVWNLPKFLVASGMILTLLEEQMAKVEQAALHDALTGLPNRRLYAVRVREAVAQAAQRHRRVALVTLDLDRFKQINDRFGHYAGDEALRTVAARFAGCLRASDTLARIGGDEFMAILDDLGDPAAAKRIVHAFEQALVEPLLIDQQPVRLGVSIGVAIYPDDATDIDAMQRLADRRMYGGKQAERPASA